MIVEILLEDRREIDHYIAKRNALLLPSMHKLAVFLHIPIVIDSLTLIPMLKVCACYPET